MKDKGSGKCQLMLNPNDMQIGARYGESYWIMGDQFLQNYYTIYDVEKGQVGLIQSNNEFSSQGGEMSDSKLIMNIANDGPAGV